MERIKETAKRIRLINATPEHAQLLFEIFSGVNTRAYSPVSMASVDELAARLEKSGSSFSEQSLFYRFFGEYNGAFFGTFIVKNIEWRDKKAEIGFCLLDEWQGQGLGSALVYNCVSKIFNESAIEWIWATVSVTNQSCQRLMQSLGFKNSGLYKDPFLINGELVSQTLFQMNREQADSLFL